MIPIPSSVRVWIATGHTDMRRGMNSLALQVQEVLKRDPHAGDLYIFRGRRGDLIKILWHDSLGMSLYAKRLERGNFIWPSPADGVVVITPAQVGYIVRNDEIHAYELRKMIGVFIAPKNTTNFFHVPSRRTQLCPRQLFEFPRRFRFVAFELMPL